MPNQLQKIMRVEQEPFELPQSLKFAWLLRQDVRGKKDVEDIDAQKDFVAWWYLFGQKEYPQVEPLSIELIDMLFEPLAGYPQHQQFGINLLLLHIYHNRKDVYDLYNIQTVQGVIAFTQWFYLYGLNELDFKISLSQKIIADLNQPMPYFWQSEPSHINLPKMSPLMFFLWFIREDIQEIFDIKTHEGRERFIAWFFLQGVVEFKLEANISSYWLNWVTEDILLNNKHPIRRAGLLFWTFRDDIRDAFDLKTQEGQHGLINWTKNAIATETMEPAYQWISQRIEQQNNQLGVNLIGFAYGELGIGEDVRMAAEACKNAGIPYTVVNISPGKSVRQNDKILSGEITDQVSQLQYKTNIFCLTGFDTLHVFLEKGRELFKGRYNIGWWPWELPVWPEQWVCAFDLIDEVWAATNYTKIMYQKATDKPVTLMPLPVSVERAIPVKRKKLGLPKNKFLFLYIFDFNSYIDRKNPHAAVKAFTEAFPKENKDVGLVLKTMNSDAKNPKWKAFQQLCKKDKRIVLLEETLDREKVLGLINACDAYLSLHRAEGFGRTPAEAMLLGKPVIATDFSGNTDFVNEQTGFPVKWKKKPVKVGEYPFITKKSKAYWAEPDILHAAEQMQAALKAADDKAWQNQIKQRAIQQFSVVRIGELIKSRLITIRKGADRLPSIQTLRSQITPDIITPQEIEQAINEGRP